jgi:hypothetical protein
LVKKECLKKGIRNKERSKVYAEVPLRTATASNIQNNHRNATGSLRPVVKKKMMKRPKEKSYVQKNN